MSRRVNITTFRQWLINANGNASSIDAEGAAILEMLQKFDPASCADVWAELGDMPELAILSKDAVFGDELVILHHAKSCGNAIYGGRRRQYAIAGLEDSPLVVAINTKKMKSSNSATKVPTNTSLLACKTE